MKHVKKIGVTAIGCLLAVGTTASISRAQTPIAVPPPGMPANIQPINPEMRRVQQLAALLGLNQNQCVQIVAIDKQAAIRERAVRANSALTTSQKLYAIHSIRRMRRDQAASVLTVPQRMRLRQLGLRS